MPDRDITEKYLEAYNDVFADIVNVLLFNGQKELCPDDLQDAKARTLYKAEYTPPVTSWELATPEAGILTERREPSKVGLITGTYSDRKSVV